MEVFVCLEDKNVIKVPSLVTADIRSVMLLLLLALLSLPAPAPALTITAPGLRVERAGPGAGLGGAVWQVESPAGGTVRLECGPGLVAWQTDIVGADRGGGGAVLTLQNTSYTQTGLATCRHTQAPAQCIHSWLERSKAVIFLEVDLGKDLCFDSFPLLATDVSVCWLRAEN